jgi:hypothetical protein
VDPPGVPPVEPAGPKPWEPPTIEDFLCPGAKAPTVEQCCNLCGVEGIPINKGKPFLDYQSCMPGCDCNEDVNCPTGPVTVVVPGQVLGSDV